MQQSLLIAVFIFGIMKCTLRRLALAFLLLLSIRVDVSEASALGLADGTYNITLDFTDNSFDATGTITISPAPQFVTSFHININGTALDCTGCAENTDTPDNVAFNDGLSFWMEDNNNIAQFRRLQIEIVGGNRTTTFLFCDGACPEVFGVHGGWTAQAVPEPMSSTLLLVGVSALGLRARIRRHTKTRDKLIHN